ncbi:MAG TPA: substrate-binding domain-containing protein [Caulobacteraceae bacterium]|nr:substrate-binding domain-containing protein [Caulobacteraceae bacterium]
MIRRLAAIAVAAFALAACGGPKTQFHIVAGSEQKSLEPLVLGFCAKQHVECSIDYKGSLDIGQMVSSPAGAKSVDAVWPASSLWIEMYDKARVVKDLKSIAQSPVVLGVKLSKAKELGWTGGKPVKMDDILQAVQAGKLKFLMTSATQSNSGASAYLAMMASAFGDGSRLDPRALDDEAARSKVKTLLGGVARSAGSSGWLGDLYVKTAKAGQPFDAMWNYEFMLKEVNGELAQAGQEPLYAIYPAEGSAYADAPLGYVDHGQPKTTHDFFAALQAYLLSPEAQAKVAEDGRRTAPGVAAQPRPDPSWNFDPARVVPSIALPEPDVIARALTIYQEALRRPSLTAICLDFSGSMSGDGETGLKAAMASILTPAEAAQNLIQWTPQDHIIVIPFDATPRWEAAADGTAASQAQLLTRIQAEEAGGGTDMYACAEKAFDAMAPYLSTPNNNYLPAVVIMTDGRSDERNNFPEIWRSQGRQVPIFGVTFGDADPTQLNSLAELSQARVFDGHADLTAAFRSARGYN